MKCVDKLVTPFRAWVLTLCVNLRQDELSSPNMGDDLWTGSEFLLPQEQRVSLCGRYVRAKANPRTYREQVASARRVNYSRVRT